jgi:type VI protein secretion system component Hcp
MKLLMMSSCTNNRRLMDRWATSRVCLFVLLGFAVDGLAQDLEVPHVFEAGTPARAAEVNANFDAVIEGVNANASALTNLAAAGIEQIGTFSIATAPYNDQAIPIFLLEWGGTLTAGGGGGGGGAAELTLGGMTIGKALDLFSPPLLGDFASAKSFASVKIDLTPADAVQTNYLLEDVHMSALGAATGVAGTPLEKVEFTYERITITSTDPDSNTTTSMCWNLFTNAAC